MESGWKAVDVTPGYYYNVATLQKMVNTPEQIKKNAAMILLGAVTVLVIAGFIFFRDLRNPFMALRTD